MSDELDEKDFIQEEYGKDPTPFWVWSFIILLVTALIWAMMLWYNNVMSEESEKNPFLQVTNRAFSLFLWQNPQYMRVHAKNKIGYLPGFCYTDKVGLDPTDAEDYVSAPPEVLFLYHTWGRLLGDLFFRRPISAGQFAAFLKDAEEWHPKNWADAPEDYVSLVQSGYAGDLQDKLPLQVRQAFVGWMNYFKEGEEINNRAWTYGELEGFLTAHPQYQQHYWCHLEPNYLASFSDNPQDTVPSEEMAPFLKVALYNFALQKDLKDKQTATKNQDF